MFFIAQAADEDVGLITGEETKYREREDEFVSRCHASLLHKHQEN